MILPAAPGSREEQGPAYRPTIFSLGQHHVPLAVIDEADLDREAALFEAASPRKSR